MAANELNARQTIQVCYAVCVLFGFLAFIGAPFFLFSDVKVGTVSCGSVVAPKHVTVDTDLPLTVAVDLPSESDCRTQRGGYEGWAIASVVALVVCLFVGTKLHRVLYPDAKKPRGG